MLILRVLRKVREHPWIRASSVTGEDCSIDGSTSLVTASHPPTSTRSLNSCIQWICAKHLLCASEQDTHFPGAIAVSRLRCLEPPPHTHAVPLKSGLPEVALKGQSCHTWMPR